MTNVSQLHFVHLVNLYTDKIKTFKEPDFSKSLITERVTRSTNLNTKCTCYLCELARTPQYGHGNFASKTLPLKNDGKFKKKKPSDSLKICDHCFGMYRTRSVHNCRLSSRVDNVSKNICENLEAVEKEKLLAFERACFK